VAGDASTRLLARLQGLLLSFNGGSLDVPDGLIDRRCVFRLNGVAYEESLGRPVSDPLVRLVGRGPAAYRLLVQALWYAVPDAAVSLERVATSQTNCGGLITGCACLRGTLRTGGDLEGAADVALVTDASGAITEMACVVDEQVLHAIEDARRT
jgi:hypothetical protein